MKTKLLVNKIIPALKVMKLININMHIDAIILKTSFNNTKKAIKSLYVVLPTHLLTINSLIIEALSEPKI